MPAMPLQELSITATSIQSLPNITLEFEPSEWLIVNMSSTATDIVYFSFDGVNVHGKVVPGSPIAGCAYKIRAKKLWLYRHVGAASPTSITVMANSEK